jgi:hypothetical protein
MLEETEEARNERLALTIAAGYLLVSESRSKT